MALPVVQSGRDIDLGTGNWNGGVSNGTTIWFIDNGTNMARAYIAATRVRDATLDIDLGTGNFAGGLAHGENVWFINLLQNRMEGYNGTTLALVGGIFIPTSQFRAGASFGDFFWLLNASTNTLVAYEFIANGTNAQPRTARNVSLENRSWNGAVTDGQRIWVIESDTGQASAYLYSTLDRDTANDLSLGAGSWLGALTDGINLWFVDDTSNMARAYTSGSVAPTMTSVGSTSLSSYDNGGARSSFSTISGVQGSTSISVDVGSGSQSDGAVLIAPIY